MADEAKQVSIEQNQQLSDGFSAMANDKPFYC